MKGTQFITFRDIESGKLPDGTYDKEIVDLVSQNNVAMGHIPWKRCLRGREDVTTIRMGLPTAVTRAYYEGVKGSKGAKKSVTNSCATVSTAIEFDARLYDDTPDKAGFLLDEVQTHVGSLEEKATTLLFYGKLSEDPKGINGFFRTFGEADNGNTDRNEAAHYVINASRASNGSQSKLRSIFLAGWGGGAAHGIYPEGATMGLRKGKLEFTYVPDPEDATKRLRVGIQELNWDIGLNIRDFRYCGRLANIEADAALNVASMPDYVELLMRLSARVQADRSVRQVMYMDKDTWEIITTCFFRKTMGNAIRYADLAQKLDGAIMGIPVGICDALATNETFVAAKSA